MIWDKRLLLWTLLGGLHAVSGVAILGISAAIARRAWRRRGTAEAAA